MRVVAWERLKQLRIDITRTKSPEDQLKTLQDLVIRRWEARQSAAANLKDAEEALEHADAELKDAEDQLAQIQATISSQKMSQAVGMISSVRLEALTLQRACCQQSTQRLRNKVCSYCCPCYSMLG